MYTTKQIKDYLKEQPAIKFAGLEKGDIKLSEFKLRILEYNKKYSTVFLNNKVQNAAGSRRSVGDLYRISTYYFPRIKLSTIYSMLLSLVADKKAVSAICKLTGMRVYRYDSGSGYFNGEPTDEFQMDIKKFPEFDNCKSMKDNWGYDYGTEEIKFVNIK